ncbi:MAG: hypothetical protein RJA36_66 [Pseudomonadota bacterium]|jgi:tripartite-type tricarboxylate transporter receptor subunit TctC
MKLKPTIAALLGACAAITSATAQTWPEKPLRFVVSFPAGAPGDIVARVLAPELQKELGQPVVVENKPGAGGNIGAQEVARATDAYTFLVGPDTMYTINPHLYRKMAIKPLDDLKPVTLLASFNQMLVCHPSTQIKNLGDFVRKAGEKRMNYASGGPGVPGHMAMEMLLDAASIKMEHVPYKGPAPAMQDVLAGQVPCGFLAAPAVGPQTKAGKLNALAVSGVKRSPGSPEVAPVAELGFKGFDASFFETLAAPRSTPPAVIDRLQKAVAKVMQQAEIRNKLQAAELDPVASASSEAEQRLRADQQKWGKVAAQIGLQLD